MRRLLPLYALMALLSHNALGCGARKYGCLTGGTLSGQLFDRDSGGLLRNALLVVQSGGLESVAGDLSRGNPAYTESMSADAAGNFAIELPCGSYGVHVYAVGYVAAHIVAQPGEPLVLGLQPQRSTDVPPVIAGLLTNPSSVIPGGHTALTVEVASQNPADPLSDQVFALYPAQMQVVALDPPSAGAAGAFPDGMWHRVFAPPSNPGHYVYGLVAASRAGLTSVSTFDMMVSP